MSGTIGLVSTRGCAMVDALVAIGDLPLKAVDTTAVGLPAYSCPYGLPAIDRGETLVVGSGWLKGLREQGHDPVSAVLQPLRERFDRLIGVDHADPFMLDFDDASVRCLDAVIKMNGLFQDRDLYNYIVGAVTPHGRWTEKVEPCPEPRAEETLCKLHLGIPCFLSAVPSVRARTRPYYYPSAPRRLVFSAMDACLQHLTKPMNRRRPPRLTAHFYASLTHAQRAEAARKLRGSSLPWTGGITGVPSWIQGLKGIGITGLSAAERGTLQQQLAAEKILAAPLNRVAYQTSMWDAKVVLSITGFGELCFRQAEAWANRRILVCQDLSHAETLFPLSPGRNVVYCRPDLSDLVEILDEIECNFARYVDIAEQGYADWSRWTADPRQVLRRGYEPLYTNN